MSSEKDREERWNDLNVTKDELDKIGKALKDEEFRKMFVEYAEEIADPKNREKYEEEIAMMEAERGMDVQFVHPKPGHVLKVFTKIPEKGCMKTFINISQNENIDKPSSDKCRKPDGTMGLQWSIPHTFSPVREDVDKRGEKCMVYDVVFSIDTYRMATNPQFRKMLEDTALDGLERQFGVEIDRTSITPLKQLKFKGRPEATILRRKKGEVGPSEAQKGEDPGSAKFPYPYQNGISSQDLAKQKEWQIREEKQKKEEEEKRRKERDMKMRANGSEIKYTECGAIIPEHKVTNQYGFDMTDFSQTTSGTQMRSDHIPSALVVTINLPGLKSASQCTLDVSERRLALESSSPERYLFELKLAYPVDDENGSAKFDKTKRTLVVTLPVKKSELLAQELSSHALVDEESRVKECNDSAMNGHIDPLTFTNVKPLIEVLPELTDGNDNVAEQEVDEKETELQTTVVMKNTAESEQSATPPHIVLDEKIDYRGPSLNFEQEDEFVSIVINVSHIESSSFKLVSLRSQVEVQFETVSPSGFPTAYYSKFAFPEEVSSVTKSIGDLNTVLTVTKSAYNVWEVFETTSAQGQTQVHTFITQKHIEAELQHLDELALAQKEHENVLPCDDDGIVITKKNKNHLTIDLKRETPSDKPSLKSPKVVHVESVPENVHSILKQRSSNSISESGDDTSISIDITESLSISVSDASPHGDNGVSPRERKKSVSFSNKIEQAKFDSSASVYKMHKKISEQRRREQAKEARRRRNSSGSSSDRYPPGRYGRRRRNSSGGSYSSISDQESLSPGSSYSDSHIPLDAATSGELSAQNVKENQAAGNGELENQAVGNGELENQAAGNGELENQASGNGELENVSTRELNSDDDLEPEKTVEKTALSWENGVSDFVEKTKCAFDFDNSVIFDLDD